MTYFYFKVHILATVTIKQMNHVKKQTKDVPDNCYRVYVRQMFHNQNVLQFLVVVWLQ